MIFSENRLRKLANLDNKITTDDIVSAINSIGFEVESVEQFNKVSGIKFGHVLDTYKNPNSNKLNVCKIQFNDGIRTIQTAAQNVKINDYLVAFVPGSIINGNTKIEAKEIGGIVSEGMLASLSELGFDESLLREEWRDNIFTINEVDLNEDPVAYFDLNDNLIDVSILSNRSDAQSYYVFAKELAAYFQSKFYFEFSNQNNVSINSNLKLLSNDDVKLNGCVVEMDDFKLGINDIVLLLKSKIKLENDINDLASLNLINMGLSARVFDYDKIGDEISIKYLNNLVFNDKEFKNIHALLNKKNEVISILGIETKNEFKINSETKKAFFEFSQIDSKIVRDNSRNSNIVNNNSINNAREISNGTMLLSYQYIKSFFTKSSQLINSIDQTKSIIKFDKDYLNSYAGFDIFSDKKYSIVKKQLELLDFEFEGNDKKIVAPLYRYDVKTMQDIVEEVFRFYGLNNFKSQKPIFNLEKQDLQFYDLEKIISTLGYTQTITYTLINKEKNIFNPFLFNETIKLKTFVSNENNAIRNSIALPMLNIIDNNLKNKIEKMSLFDIGMINDKKALLICSNTKSYLDIKSDLEKISKQKFIIKELKNELLHPNYNAGLFVENKMIGWIGKFNPHHINSDFIFGEIFIDCISAVDNKFKQYDLNPLKERDITFSIKDDESIKKYLEEIYEIEGIYEIKLISTYKKDNGTNLTYKVKMNEKAILEFDKKFNN